MKFDHVALNVSNIQEALDWYVRTLHAKVLYQDDTWALLEAAGVRLALTLPHQHPSHLAFDVGPNPPPDFLRNAKRHRDGSLSKYVVDPDGNAIEWIFYPEVEGMPALKDV